MPRPFTPCKTELWEKTGWVKILPLFSWPPCAPPGGGGEPLRAAKDCQTTGLLNSLFRSKIPCVTVEHQLETWPRVGKKKFFFSAPLHDVITPPNRLKTPKFGCADVFYPCSATHLPSSFHRLPTIAVAKIALFEWESIEIDPKMTNFV